MSSVFADCDRLSLTAEKLVSTVDLCVTKTIDNVNESIEAIINVGSKHDNCFDGLSGEVLTGSIENTKKNVNSLKNDIGIIMRSVVAYSVGAGKSEQTLFGQEVTDMKSKGFLKSIIWDVNNPAINYKKARYNGTTVWYSVIPSDKKPSLAVANDNYNRLSTEPTSDIAKRKNAKLAINFGLTGAPAGMIYTDGVLVADAKNSCDETLYMNQDGTLNSVRNSEYSTQDIIDMDPVWASKGFYPIARDGEYLDENKIDKSLSRDKHPRTFIGQDYDGNYIVGVCDGRGEDEAGLTLKEVYDFVNTEVTDDLRFLFNGDGGGSSAFVYDGEKLNSDVDGVERERPDAIYWT